MSRKPSPILALIGAFYLATEIAKLCGWHP